MLTAPTQAPAQETRRIIGRTRGRGHGSITRLMSPSDLGQVLKPFVFLDLFNGESTLAGSMPIHPHSGIATVTVLTEGDFRFDDPDQGSGTLAPGGVEWMRAGGGVWHGKELTAGTSAHICGFQLWLALGPELENGPVDSQYIEASSMPVAGSSYVILGEHAGAKSPVRCPAGINYLLVRLKPGEHWEYQPPERQEVAWISVSHGALVGASPVAAGDLAVFERGQGNILCEASPEAETIFVIGSARPHEHELHMGSYSIHSSPEALEAGEARIAELGERIRRGDHARRPSGAVPVFR